ncbi:hypothetical protein MIR68_004024 [Amoeboaphelidium protococcarum]|nr:hypothetical protein MIR68_004024 [Amoeboaphelidium protococcarum]
MKQFDIKANTNLRPGNVPFAKPQEVGYLSIGPDRVVKPMSNESLRQYSPMCTPEALQMINLSNGYPEKYIERDQTINEGLDAILQTLDFIKYDITEDFVTWRGILTRLMLTCDSSRQQNPHFQTEEWKFKVYKVNGVIYIQSSPKWTVFEELTDVHKLLTYHGYKFEAMNTAPLGHTLSPDLSDEITRRDNDTIDTHVQYGLVLKLKIGSHSVLIGAEADCIDESRLSSIQQQDVSTQNTDRLEQFVELKTSKVIRNARHQASFERFKLPKFYFQSFLVATKRICVGFRDENGRIESVTEFETLKIPRIVRHKGYWDPMVHLDFLAKVLKFIQDNIEHDTVDDDGEHIQYYQLSHDKNSPFIQLSPCEDPDA